MPFKNPERRREYQRDRARLRRAGRMEAPAKARLPDAVRVQTAQDVLQLVGEQINLVRADPNLGTVECARTVGSLAGVALRAVETADLETRLAALETALKRRKRAP